MAGVPGVIYPPEMERISHYFQARLPDQFDAVLHFDATRAVEPLERTAQWQPGEPAETCPTACRHSMANREIPRGQWTAFFDSFSLQHGGWIVRVEVQHGADSQLLVRALPLLGITLDLKGVRQAAC